MQDELPVFGSLCAMIVGQRQGRTLFFHKNLAFVKNSRYMGSMKRHEPSARSWKRHPASGQRQDAASTLMSPHQRSDLLRSRSSFAVKFYL